MTLEIHFYGMAGWTRRCEAFGAGKPAAPRSRTGGLRPTASRGHRKEPRITSDLPACGLSRMAITNDLPSVFCWVSQMASSLISSFISWDEAG
jgi:hypothetical protein